MNLTQKQLNFYFISGCTLGNIETVEYYLLSSELKKHADINAENGLGIIMATKNNHLNIVEFLIKSPKLINHINSLNYTDCFKTACANGFLNIVKFFLSENMINNEIIIEGFKESCGNNKKEIIQFLLENNSLSYNNEIKRYFIFHPNKELEKIFIIKEMYDNLNNNIVVNNKKLKQGKI